jgi:hypothetical protein
MGTLIVDPYTCGSVEDRLGAAHDPRQRFRGNKHAAMIIEWSLSIESVARQLFDEFPICLENSTIGPGEMYTLGVSSQRLMAYLASDRVTEFVRH